MHTGCGKKLTFDQLKEKSKETNIDYQDTPYIWKDSFDRGPVVYEGYDPSDYYGRYFPPGTVDEKGRELAADRNPRKAKPTGFTWVPGDVPLIQGGGICQDPKMHLLRICSFDSLCLFKSSWWIG